jgi:hypothetical protein
VRRRRRRRAGERAQVVEPLSASQAQDPEFKI